jgi:anti-sigma factor RsiW
MMDLLRRRERLDLDLSAYLDGELEPQHREAVLERLTLDPNAQAAFRSLRRADELARLAAAPQDQPDLHAAMARLQEAVEARPAAGPLARAPARRRQLRLHPALIASAGLLFTAGVAVVELRRRGKL